MFSNLETNLNPEEISNWFFRLNGCMSIPNFIVHPDRGRGSQRTDVDVLAVRFPYRAELLTSGEPMQDHYVFNSNNQIDIILAEVKHGLCRLNGPWTNPPDENMHHVLHAIGAFEADNVPEVAESLYENGQYNNEHFRVRLFAIGSMINDEILPGAVQLTWDDLLTFIHARFNLYRNQKSQHNQWDPTGRTLFRIAVETSAEAFIDIIKECMYRHVHPNAG